MYVMKRAFFNIVVATFFLQVVSGNPAAARAGLMAWPSKVDLAVEAGGTKSGFITVQNQGLNKIHLKAVLMNCRMTEDGSIIYTNKNVSFGCKQWLKVEPQEFDLSPRTNIQILYSIEIPKNAQGTYMAVILFNDNIFDSGDYQNLAGALVIENVPGTGQRNADISELSFLKGIGGGNVSAVVAINNKGSLICTPTGSLEIIDVARGTKTSFGLNREKEPVLPFSLRRYQIPLEGLYNGQYKVLAVVDYQGGEILQGEATVTITAGELVSHQGRVLPGRAKPGGQQEAVRKESGAEPPARSVKPGGQTAAPSLSAGEAEQLNKDAVKLYSEGDYEKALVLWQKILRSNPGHAAAKKGAERARQKIEALKKAR